MLNPKVFIVTDSAADLIPSERMSNEIRVVPLTIFFDEQTYLDGETIQATGFYQQWKKSDIDPTTSPPSPDQFYHVYREILDKHPDSRILSIHLSENLSNTLRSAKLAKSMFSKNDRIQLYNSKSASFGFGRLVLKAAAMAKSGSTIEEIVKSLDRVREKQRFFLLVDSLDHLHRGGRIGSASVVIGSIFNMKPILTVDDDGKIAQFDKGNGRKGAIKKLIQSLLNTFGTRKITLTIMHAEGLEFAELIDELCCAKLTIDHVSYRLVSPAIATHVGIGAVAILARCEDDFK